MKRMLCKWIAVWAVVGLGVGATAVAQTQGIAPDARALLEPLAMAEVFKLDPGMKAFRLYPLDCDDCTRETLPDRELIAFAVSEFDPGRRLDLRRAVLLMLPAPGWLSERGVNEGLISWQWVSGPEWSAMFAAYLETTTQIRPVDGQVPVFISSPASTCLTADGKSVPGTFRDPRPSPAGSEPACYRGSGKVVPITDLRFEADHYSYRASEATAGVDLTKASIPFIPLAGNVHRVAAYREGVNVIGSPFGLSLHVISNNTFVRIPIATVKQVHTFLTGG